MSGEGQEASTLAARERRLAPISLGCFGAAALGCASALAFAVRCGTQPAPVAVATLLSALPLLSDAVYLATHEDASIGMIPPALFALIPAAVLIAGQDELSHCARLALILVALLLACVLILFCTWFWKMGNACAHQPGLAGDAALIVLGATVRGGGPCRTLKVRLDLAAQLLKEAPRRVAVVSGAGEAEVMASYLEERGIDPARIMREGRARNTRENISLSLQALRERGVESSQTAVVSSDYHLWRARDHGRRLGVKLVCVPARTPRTGRAQQWCREVLTILFGGS